VLQVQGKSKRETEQILLARHPEPVRREQIRPVSIDSIEVRFVMSDETRKAMERYWELKGRCSVTELFSACLEFFLNQKDPERRAERAAVRDILDPGPRSSNIEGSLFPEKVEPPKRYIRAAVRKLTRQKSQGRCEYVDPETGRRCESRYLLQFDHIDPYCSGGASDEENIRQLCRMHNQWFAGKMFQSEIELLSSSP
jgi:hypothetical protein